MAIDVGLPISPIRLQGNILINPLGAINVRAVSGTVVLPANTYGHDRWRSGAGGCTYTFNTVGNVTTFTITAGTLQQVVHSSNVFTSDHILSWVGSSNAQIDGGGFSTSPITASLTGGTDATVEFGTGTMSLPQLERKDPDQSKPTEFDYRDPQLERLIASWYSYKITVASSGGYHATTRTGNWIYGDRFFHPLQQMRVGPTIILTDGGSVTGASISDWNSSSTARKQNADTYGVVNRHNREFNFRVLLNANMTNVNEPYAIYFLGAGGTPKFYFDSEIY